MIKVILIKNINNNKYSNEIDIVNDIIKKKKTKEITILLFIYLLESNSRKKHPSSTFVQ